MDSGRLHPDKGLVAQPADVETPGFPTRASDSRLEAATDVQTQMESLLDCVWQAEQTWQVMDRIDLAIALEEQRELQRLRLQGRGLRSA
jgi:hypothetical protein